MFKLLSTLLLIAAAAMNPAMCQDKPSYDQLEELARQRVFKPQYVIPIQLSNHPVLVLLKDHGLLDLRSNANQLMLPVDRELAQSMRLPRYAETPLPSYLEGVSGQLDRVWATAEANGANSGDKDALLRAADDVIGLQNILKAALINGDVQVAD
jgi:hypothetical protein